MPNPDYQRFAISIPSLMATQIEEACKVDGRNPSEFFCEAVRFYMDASRPSQAPQWVMPGNEEEHRDNPFRLFHEWDSEADAVYDMLCRRSRATFQPEKPTSSSAGSIAQ